MRTVRYGIALGAWLVAGYVSLWVAANTQIGPTVAVLSATHGVHSGDLVVLVVGAAAASLVTLAALRLPDPVPNRVTRTGAPASPAVRRRPGDPGRG